MKSKFLFIALLVFTRLGAVPGDGASEIQEKINRSKDNLERAANAIKLGHNRGMISTQTLRGLLKWLSVRMHLVSEQEAALAQVSNAPGKPSGARMLIIGAAGGGGPQPPGDPRKWVLLALVSAGAVVTYFKLVKQKPKARPWYRRNS